MKDSYWGDGTPTDSELGYAEQRGSGEDDGPRDVLYSSISLRPPNGRYFVVAWSWHRRGGDNEPLDVELIVGGKPRKEVQWRSLAPWIFNAMYDHMEREVARG